MRTRSRYPGHGPHRQTFLFRGLLVTATLLFLGLGFAQAAAAAPGVYDVSDYGAKGNGVTNDAAAFQQAIDQAATDGGTVSVPSGTFLIDRTLSLRSGIRIAGNAGLTVLTMPANGSSRFILAGSSLQNVALEGLALKAASPADNISGLYMVGARNSRLSRLRFDNLEFGMKLGSGPVARGWIIEDIVARNCEIALYASHVEDSSFARLDLQAVLGPTNQNHTVYLERELHGLTFTDVKLAGGSGYTLQMYLEGGTSSGTSTDITFQNLVLDATGGRYPLVIWGGWSNIILRNVIIKARPNIGPVVMLEAPQDVIFDGFSASGGDALVRTYDDQTTHAKRITLRNGNYDGPALPTSDKSIDALVVENVSLGAASTGTTTTTTVRPTTTTTTAPLVTTTTTIVPVPPSNTTTQVTISSPTDGSVVQGKVDVGMKITSAVAVGKVRLYVDGRLIATDYRAPYAFIWNTRSAVPGSTHILAGVAYGASGVQTGKTVIAVNVARSTSTKLLLAAASTPVVAVAGVFPDLTLSSPYGEAVLALAEAGVVSGFEDGRFGADSPVTRAQVAKMVARTLGIADGESTSTPFVDLDPADADLYPHKYIAALFSLGAVEGTSPDQFSPWDSVSRAQLVTIAVRALRTLAPEALGAPPAGFVSSMGDFNPSHEESMRIAEYNGLLGGLYGYGSAWDPWVPATRGEVAQILHNLTILE